MIRKVFIIVFVLIISLSCSTYVFAVDLPTVESALKKPVTSYYVDSSDNLLHVVNYAIRQDDQNNNLLYKQVCIVDPTAELMYRLNNDLTAGLYSTKPILSCEIIVYDIVSGSLLEDNIVNIENISYTYNNISYTYRAGFRNGYFPKMGYYLNNINGWYVITSDNIVLTETTSLYANQYVIWHVDPAPLNLYITSLSEPVSDDLNRYVVLCGKNKKRIFVLSYFISEYDTIKNNILNQDLSNWIQYNNYLKNYISPKLTLSNGYLSLSLYCNQDIYDLVNNPVVQVISSYDVMVTEYDFETGLYIKSKLYNDILLSTSEVQLDYDFGNIKTYDSIKVYDIFYVDDNSSEYHYNYLNALWQQDPALKNWQNNMLLYIKNIYDLLSQQAEEQVTIADNMQAVDDMESARDALQVTGSNGQPVDAGEAAGEIFSNAAVELGNLSDSTGTINSLMQRMIFSKPKLLLPLIVALSLGLLVTIVGKNKSD